MATIIKGKNKNKPFTVRKWHEGRNVEQSFATLREAKNHVAQFEHSRRDGTYIDPRQADERFEDAARRMIARQRNPRTQEVYLGALLHLKPILSRPLRAVANDRDGIEDLCIGHPQGRRMLTVIRLTCQSAVNAGKLSGHRLTGLKANAVPGKRDLIMATNEQIMAMADAMGTDGLALRILWATGMRLGEVLALTKADFIQSVDGNWQVHVYRQIQDGEFAMLKGRRDWKGRDIPVAPALARMVAERQETGLLFTIKANSFRQKFIRHAIKAGLPRNFTPHQTRHHFATKLLGRNIPLTDVARWMGDSSRVVEEVYAHLLTGQTSRAVAILAEDYEQAA